MFIAIIVPNLIHGISPFSLDQTSEKFAISYKIGFSEN